MKYPAFFLPVLLFLSFFPHKAGTQILERAGELINTVIAPTEQVETDSVKIADSLAMVNRMAELELQIRQMELNELILKDELYTAIHSTAISDSIRKVNQEKRIDSLRNITMGVPVIIDQDTLFTIYTNKGGVSPLDRCMHAQSTILDIGKRYSLRSDTAYIYETENFSDIMYGGKVVYTVTDYDAIWNNLSREELAEQYRSVISTKINELKKAHSISRMTTRILLFLIVFLAQIFLIKLTNFIFRKLKSRILWLTNHKFRPVKIKDYELMNKKQQGKILLIGLTLLKWIVLIVQLIITIPILFSIFPQTESLARTLFSYILDPIKIVAWAIIDYIPNLFLILIIYFIIRYTVKGLHYFAGEIESGKLKIKGFYPDWAQPTFNIIRFLLYAFMIAMIYPHLPGADSSIFQGISIILGLIVSLGASTAISNAISGLVITYMRPFRVGDRIKLNETTGNVIEKTPFVTRIRTLKNEIVTIPNSFIMSSQTVNYSESARQYGLIIHATISFGYEIPWQKVHSLLIKAASHTEGVQKHPKPFVLETELADDYVYYQINVYIGNANNIPTIYSDLHRNIQDICNAEGIELVSPRYIAERDGSASVIHPPYTKE